ncbi:MAG: Membrane protein [Frankiales bacterium]|jgi:sortase A|nr:Membrane protein [Frankiales bacterium]
MQPSFVTPAVPDKPRSLGSLLGDSLRRRGGRRALSVLSVVLFVAGSAMFAYPVITDVYSHIRQGNLNSQFGGAQYETKYSTHQIGTGDVLTKLIINTSKVKLKVLVVEGTTPAALRAGAGHYPSTPLPGEDGNVGIAGHRTTFGRPFNHLDEMKPGDQVLLETPFKVFHYVAVAPFGGHANPWVTNPKDFSVVENVPGHHFLTLTTCNPKGSARERLVLRLELNPKLTETLKQKGASK